MTSWNLIYITSNGHSGSTLLDMLIGSTWVHHFGEIISSRWRRKGYVLVGPNIKNALSGVISIYDFIWWWPDNWIARRLCHQDEFRRSNHALRMFFKRKQVLANRFTQEADEIKSLLVDSSINVLLYTLFDGLRVSSAQTWQREGIFLRCVLLFCLWSRYKYLRRKPHLLVSYEELCSHPEQVMNRIMNKLIRFWVWVLDWSSHDHHNVNGNKRTRTTRQSSIRLDERWGETSVSGSVLLCSWLRLNSRLAWLRYGVESCWKFLAKLIEWTELIPLQI